MLIKQTKESLYMNVAKYVYIVHSDINENNIYAEFATEEEAIEYAKRHKDELTYVDKVEVTLDEAGDIAEIFDERTIWVYDDEDEADDYEEDEESDDWSVCVVTLDDGDSDWEYFDSEYEARDYFNNYTSYESGRDVEVQLYSPEGMEDSYVIEADEDLDESVKYDDLVETLEENEDIVECRECFELFPKEACTKVAIGYICPECGKVHSHEEPEFEIDSIPEVVIADDDFFKVDFPEVERHEYGNDMIPDEPTPEVENDPISEPECVGPECEAPVEAPVTKDETITKLVVDEHEAIDGYEKAKIEIEANSELDEKEKEEILDTIEHIKEEEVEHIEELEELIDEVEETKETEVSDSEDDPEVLVEDDALVDTRKRTSTWAKPLDYTSKEDLYRLDVFIKKARKNGANKLTKDSVIKFGNKRVLTAGLADCNSLEDVEKKLDPYFEYLPNSIYNKGIEAYDEIVSVLPEILWELKTGISVDKEGLDESLKSWDCWFDEKYLGTVEAEDEQSAYDEMCDTWPEYPYGLYDGVAQVIEAEEDSEVLVEGSGFLGKVVLDDYFKKDGQRNPENKNGTGYWVDLIDPDTKESIIKPEDKKTVQKLKEAETIATHLSRAEDGWAIIRVEGAQGWNGILEVYEKGKRTQDITQKKLANLNKAWDEQEATKKARKALDKSLGKDKPKDADSIDLPGNNEQQPNENQNNTNVNNNGQDNQVEAKVIPTQGQLRSAYRLLVALLGTRAKATEYITVEGKGINAKYNLVQGKTFDDASLKIKELQKAALGESLTEHVNEEHPAIESDQELEGIDNAVVDCKVNKVITHSEDEKPVDCEGKKKPLEKPLTESSLVKGNYEISPTEHLS
jgi:hypothetical protein